MRERPILFSAPMVSAILDDRKTKTRRAVRGIALDWLAPGMFTPEFVADPGNHLCPYGVPGDRLWVRETLKRAPNLWTYAADGALVDWPARHALAGKTRDTIVSIHMPREASRITLQITDVRVERLNDISEADALAEGLQWIVPGKWAVDHLLPIIGDDPRQVYRELWEHINGPGSWDANPWVWAITFERVSK